MTSCEIVSSSCFLNFPSIHFGLLFCFFCLFVCCFFTVQRWKVCSFSASSERGLTTSVSPNIWPKSAEISFTSRLSETMRADSALASLSHLCSSRKAPRFGEKNAAKALIINSRFIRVSLPKEVGLLLKENAAASRHRGSFCVIYTQHRLFPFFKWTIGLTGVLLKKQGQKTRLHDRM